MESELAGEASAPQREEVMSRAPGSTEKSERPAHDSAAAVAREIEHNTARLQELEAMNQQLLANNQQLEGRVAQLEAAMTRLAELVAQ